jgi:hypothetical protein
VIQKLQQDGLGACWTVAPKKGTIRKKLSATNSDNVKDTINCTMTRVDEVAQYIFSSNAPRVTCNAAGPIPASARSKACVCCRLLAGNAGSNPAGDIDICLCDSGVLSGRGLCVGLNTHPEKSYRVWCVCDREASTMRKPWPTRGC